MGLTPDWAALVPMLILTGAGALLPIVGAFDGRRPTSGGAARAGIRIRPGVLAALSVATILAAGVLLVATFWQVTGITAGTRIDLPALPGASSPPSLTGFMPRVSGATPPVLSFKLLELTPFVVLFDLVFLAVALVVALGSARYIQRRHQGEYYGLLLLSTVGMMVVAGSRELITLFVGLELSSFCTYALAGFHKRRIASAEASMKYFLIGSISSALAIFGISLVYGLTGDTSFAALSRLWTADGGVIGASMLAGRFTLGVFVWVLLLAGFGYKVAIVPFHNYAVDVYDGAPTTVSGFLAAGSKQMGFAALFKVFLLGLFAVKANWDIAVGLIAIVTMIVGNVAALAQTNIKRMLAYSSIAQAGYILMALAIGTPYALAGGFFHIVTYSFMKVGAFIALAAAATWGVGETMDDWKGMGKRAPFLAFGMAVFLLSFAGIPPLAGFASKFVLFSSAIQAAAATTNPTYVTLYYALVVTGIVTSAISLVYYWRLIRVMYVEEDGSRRLAISSSAAVAVFIALAATLVIGLYPRGVIDLAFGAAVHLFNVAITGG